MFSKWFSDKSGFALPIAIGALVFFIIIIGVWAALNLSLFKTSSAQTSSIQALSACEEGISYAMKKNLSLGNYQYTSQEGLNVSINVTNPATTSNYITKVITASVNVPQKRTVTVYLGNVIPGAVIANGNINMNSNSTITTNNPSIPGALLSGTLSKDANSLVIGPVQHLSDFTPYKNAITQVVRSMMPSVPPVPTNYTTLSNPTCGSTLTGNYVLTDGSLNSNCNLTINGNLVINSSNFSVNTNSSLTVNGNMWSNTLNINSNANLIVNKNLYANGSVTDNSNSQISIGNNLILTGNGSALILNSNSDTISGSIIATGNNTSVTFNSNSTVNGNIIISDGNLDINSNVNGLSGLIYVGDSSGSSSSGNITINSNNTINGLVYAAGSAQIGETTVQMNSNSNINGALLVESGNLQVNAGSEIVYNPANFSNITNLLSNYLSAPIITGSWHEPGS
jgi:Tfp pilus assembly major pilin PilA